jgi:hypothetical protein
VARGPRAASLLVAALLIAPACIPDGLAFVQSDKVEITEPDYREKITLPLTISWDVKDFEVTGPNGESRDDAGYFAVFFDETPIPPGKTLDYVAHDDFECNNTPGCPDDVYLADRGIYETTDTSLTVKRVPDLDAFEGHETHEVTVILLDGTGRRIGENAWFTQFLYDREVLS